MKGMRQYDRQGIQAAEPFSADLEIHNVMQAAQDAATHYLEEMRLRCEEEYQQILKKAKDDAAAIIEKAQQEAAEIIMKANNANSDYDPVVDTILTEWKRLWFIALHLYPPVEPAV